MQQVDVLNYFNTKAFRSGGNIDTDCFFSFEVTTNISD